MKKWLVSLNLLYLSCSQPIHSQQLSPEIFKIKQFADLRDSKALIQLSRNTPSVDEEILIRFGSLQDESQINWLFEKLNSPVVKVRLAALFAIGQTLRKSTNGKLYEQILFDKLASEKNISVKAALLCSLGEFGSEEMLFKVASISYKESALSVAQAKAIARFANRRIISREASRKAAQLYSPNNQGLNWAIYALSRIAGQDSIHFFLPTILNAAHSQNSDERMHAALALGKIRTDESFDVLLNLLNDKDWRVIVNAIRALQSFASVDVQKQEIIVGKLILLFGLENYHVSKTILETFARVDFLNSDYLKKIVTPAILSKLKDSSYSLKTTAYSVLSQVDPNQALMLIEEYRARDSISISVLESIGIIAEKEKTTRPELVLLLQNELYQKDSKRASAALQSLYTCWRVTKIYQSNGKNLALYEGAFLKALDVQSEFGNASAVQVTLKTLTDTLFSKKEYANLFVKSLSHFRSTDNVETVIALLDAIKTCNEKGIVSQIEVYLNDANQAVREKTVEVIEHLTGERKAIIVDTKPEYEWNSDLPKQFKSNPLVVLNTKYGEVEMELFLQEATFTVLHFIALAQNHFFDGLLFHRVVSNFVIQGGDPKGDGTGGSKITIRSEFTPRSFERGMLGMASAGKDTEGSQWFVMHASHPHLDGRYTLFGKVVRGMDVIDKIEQDDIIISMKLR